MQDMWGSREKKYNTLSETQVHIHIVVKLTTKYRPTIFLYHK